MFDRTKYSNLAATAGGRRALTVIAILAGLIYCKITANGQLSTCPTILDVLLSYRHKNTYGVLDSNCGCVKVPRP